jgi:hypothetical protein
MRYEATMDIRQSLERLKSELARRGLPRAYIQRFIAELDDHIEDFGAERNQPMSTAGKPTPDLADRLGDPEQLAAFAAEKYHARSFFGRHPVFTFIVAPLPLVVLMSAGYLFATSLALWLLGLSPEQKIDQFFQQSPSVLTAVRWTWIVIPSLLSALVLCWLARRNARNWRWSTASCVILAVVASTLMFKPIPVTPQMGPDVNGAIILFGFYGSQHAVRLAIAISVGLLLAWWTRYRPDVDGGPVGLADMRRAA